MAPRISRCVLLAGRHVLATAVAALALAGPAFAAGDAAVDGGTLRLTGTPGEDRIVVNWAPDGTASLVATGITPGAGCTADKHGDVRCAGVQRVEADLGDGDDSVAIEPVPDPHSAVQRSVPVPLVARGGAGADRLWGADGDDVLDGGPGADSLGGDGGNDVLRAADGSDDEVISCGEGLDEAQVDTPRGYVINERPDDCEHVEEHDGLAPGATPTERGWSTIALVDAQGVVNDVSVVEDGTTFTMRDAAGLPPIPGCASPDAMTVRCERVRLLNVDLGAGDDRLTWQTTGAGGARLSGGAGPGADRLSGSPLGDDLRGGEGNDVLEGGGGHDRLSGEAGDDTLVGGAGFDQLTGGDGRDAFDLRDGGGIGRTETSSKPTWLAAFDERPDCVRGERVTADPLDRAWCRGVVEVRDTTPALPAGTMPAVRVVVPDLDAYHPSLKVVVRCPRGARDGCRGGVGLFRRTRRNELKSFDLRAGGRAKLDLGWHAVERVVRGRTANRLVVQGSDGAGHTRSKVVYLR